MTEILTESFCERCGTRYTFEVARPQTSRIVRVRAFTKGVRNFVLSDDSSFSEAMAEARGEEERAATSLQLDEFHKTFNFCLSCRQYTCGNCWNDVEGRCLSCAPVPGSEEPAPPPAEAVAAPELRVEPPAPIEASAWPTVDLPPAPAPIEVAIDEAVEPERGLDVAAAAAPETEAPGPTTLPVEAAAPLLAGMAPGESLEDAIAAYEAAQLVEASLDATVGESVEPMAGSVAAEPESEAVRAPSAPVAAQEPAAAEPEPVAAVAEPEPVAAVAEPVAVAAVVEPEPVAAVVAEPEPVPAVAEPEPVAAVAEPVAVAAPEPVAEPEAVPWAAEPEAERVAAIAQPTAVEPEPAPTPPEQVSVAPAPIPIAPEPALPAAAAAEPVLPPPATTVSAPGSGWLTVAPDDGQAPSWPTVPAWPLPSPRRDVPTTLAGRPLVPQGDSSLLWAASAREVMTGSLSGGLQTASSPVATATPQPCVGCGLPLSASARFCRRCGTRQGQS